MRFILFSAMIFCLSSCMFFSERAEVPAQKRGLAQASSDDELTDLDKAILDEKSFTYNDLVKTLKDAPVKSVAGVLAQIRKTNPGFLVEPVLMYRSHSMQSGTFENPRAILFGKYSDRLFLTFNGDKSQKGYNSLEVLSVNEKTGESTLREFIFKKEGAVTKAQREEMDFENDWMLASKPNPSRCLDCHGFVSTRPLFENYKLWPGAYFSYEDVNPYVVVGTNYYEKTLLSEYLSPNSKFIEHSRAFDFKRNIEREGWAKFSPKLNNDPRYSKLFFNPQSDRSANTELTNTLAMTVKSYQVANLISKHPKREMFLDRVSIALQCSEAEIFSAIRENKRLRSKLTEIFRKQFDGEKILVDEELKDLGPENVVFRPAEAKTQDLLNLDPDLKVSSFTALEKEAASRVAFSRPVAFSVFESIDDDYGQLFTQDWTSSQFNGGVFRDVVYDDQVRQRILGNIADNIGPELATKYLTKDCSHLEQRLQPPRAR